MDEEKAKRIDALCLLLKALQQTAIQPRSHVFYMIKLPQGVKRLMEKMSLLPYSGIKTQRMRKYELSASQKGLQPSWAWFVCCLAVHADMCSKTVYKWDVKEKMSFPIKKKTPISKKGFSLHKERVRPLSISQDPEKEMQQYWNDLIQQKEERHFQIDRIIKYLSQ